jgi:uncharacterized protein
MSENINILRLFLLFKEHLSNLWAMNKPLCQLFSTKDNYYLYDTGTNKLLKCTETEYNFLSDLISMDIDQAIDRLSSKLTPQEMELTVLSLEAMIAKENILMLTKIEGFGMAHRAESVLEKIENRLEMIQLEVTEACNLRCGYCVYNEHFLEKRNHGRVKMSDAIARKAIDYLLDHSRKSEITAVSFYGGEPLLNFLLIKKTVEYAKRQFKKKELRFNFTTNATLIDCDAAKYFAEEDFSILVSLDGPREIHDEWRRDKLNRGSFNRTLRGLRRLTEAYSKHASGERFMSKLGLSMVYTPPYDDEKLDLLTDFIESTAWIPSDIRITISYPETGTIPESYYCHGQTSHKEYESNLWQWTKKRYLDAYMKNKTANPIAKSSTEPVLARLVKRPLFDQPKKESYLNGCCVPGGRKLFITARGEMQLCERMNRAPMLGDVY